MAHIVTHAILLAVLLVGGPAQAAVLAGEDITGGSLGIGEGTSPWNSMVLTQDDVDQSTLFASATRSGREASQLFPEFRADSLIALLDSPSGISTGKVPPDATSLREQAVEEIPHPPGAVILFASGLCGLVGMVLAHGKKPLRTIEVSAGSGGRTNPDHSQALIFVSPDCSLAHTMEERWRGAGLRSRDVLSGRELCDSGNPQSVALLVIDRRVSDWDLVRTDNRFSHVPIILWCPRETDYQDADLLSDLERGADGVHLAADGDRLLLARIRTYLRRLGRVTPSRAVYQVGAVEMDTDTRQVTVAGERIELSAKPFAILEALMRVPSKVFTRGELIDLVWGSGFAVGEHTLDVHVHTLRRQLERDPNGLCRLVSIKGVGFKLKIPEFFQASSDEKRNQAFFLPAVRSVVRRDSTVGRYRVKGRVQTPLFSSPRTRASWPQTTDQHPRLASRERTARAHHQLVRG